MCVCTCVCVFVHTCMMKVLPATRLWSTLRMNSRHATAAPQPGARSRPYMVRYSTQPPRQHMKRHP